MDENKVPAPAPTPAPAQEQTDPLANWKSASSLIIGVAAAFFLYRNGGGYYSLLLFLPIKRIVDGILDNTLQKIVAGLLLLPVYPVLLNSIPKISRGISARFQMQKMSSTESGIANLLLFGAIFLAATIPTGLAGKAFPKCELPKKIHARIMAAIFILTLVTGLFCVYFALVYCNGRFFHLPEAVNLLLPLLLAVIGVSAGCRVVKQTLNPAPKKENNGRESAPGQQLGIRPNTKLSDVAGMSAVKEQIRLRLIEPIRNPDKAKKYGLKTGGGVLLYGPPGTGKTFLARAVAGELNLPFYMITPADVFGKYVGESEKNIRELFNNARRNPLSVIFVDEMETIFSKRTDNIHEVTQKVISYILQELDGVDQNKNPILLLGATNTPWRIDEAFLRPGRFDILAFVDLPDRPARMQIVKAAFKTSTLPQETGLLEYIADSTEGYSGADLNGLVSRIQQQAFQRGDALFTSQLAYEIMLKNPPPANSELIARIREWEANRKGVA